MFARTERLLLRPGWREDAPALAQAIGDEAIVRNLARAPWPYRETDAEAFLSGWTDGHPSRFLMVRRTASAPRMIGGIGIDRRENGEAELAFRVAWSHWGPGSATEPGPLTPAPTGPPDLPRLHRAPFLDIHAPGA